MPADDRGARTRPFSLARAALAQGGMEQAIRTYARRSYRFFAEAASAQCAGYLAEAAAPLERAVAAHSAAGDREATARVLLALARVRLELAEGAVGRGCLRRARALIEALPQGELHGHLAWIGAGFALFAGDLTAALEQARSAHELGRRLQNEDIETMGLLYWGIALQGSGETRLGAELQDEAGAAVLAGAVASLVGGIVYCGLISGCCNRGDWCARYGIEPFAGACQLHRALVVFLAMRVPLEAAAVRLRARSGLDGVAVRHLVTTASTMNDAFPARPPADVGLYGTLSSSMSSSAQTAGVRNWIL